MQEQGIVLLEYVILVILFSDHWESEGVQHLIIFSGVKIAFNLMQMQMTRMKQHTPNLNFTASLLSYIAFFPGLSALPRLDVIRLSRENCVSSVKMMLRFASPAINHFLQIS